jgi:hypothetical protein
LRPEAAYETKPKQTPQKKETTMKTKTISGIKVKATIKAGGMHPNHVRAGLKVRASIKAGEILQRNHSARRLAVD